jgi:GrpB-like predicted nucleotidyltransferase (UPF0157 family)
MLLQEYNENWIKEFNEIQQVIKDALLPLPVSTEHIGSTSVKGLAAKPVIDIDVVFAKDVVFDAIKICLEKIGYYHNGNQGIADREVFKRDNTPAKHKVLDGIAHHLYVCPTGSKELQRHILFRDYLIANKEVRIQYQNLKYAIAKEANQDRKKYAQLKEAKATTFINTIIAKAKKYKPVNEQHCINNMAG